MRFLKGILVVLIAAIAVASKGLSIRIENIFNIMLQSSVRGIASVGQAFVILSGGIDVSVGGVGLMAATLGAAMMTEAPELNIIGFPLPMPLGVFVMMMVGAAWGALNGSLISRIGIPALIVTLGMWQITEGAAFQVKGGWAIAYQPASLAFFGQGRISGIPVPVFIFAGVAAVAYFVLNHTTFGRSVYATGGNPVSAWLSGLNVKNIQLLVFVISGFLAGLAGVIMTARVMSAAMRTLVGLEIDSIAAVTVGGISLMGGRGSLIGVVLGVIIIGVVNNAMSVLGAGPAEAKITKGVIIILAVAIDYIRRRRG